MTTADVTARLASLKLQAAMVRAGFSDVPTLALRLLPADDADELLAAVRGICGPDAHPVDAATNGAALACLHGTRQTHVVVPPDLVDVPDDVVDALKAMLDAVKAFGSPTFGWMVGVDRSDPKSPGVLMRLTLASEKPRRPKIDGHAGIIGAALGVSVVLEAGALAKQHVRQLWPFLPHSNFGTGMSIGTGGGRRGTIAMPVRLKSAPHERYFLTAGHVLPEEANSSPVRQPWDNENPNRQIGAAARVEYESTFDAINYFDVALIKATRQLPSLQFGSKQKHQLAGVHEADLTQGEIAYIFCPSTGLVNVRILYTDVETTMLSNQGNRLIYRDIIEFSLDVDNHKPASVPGDSGAPLLIRGTQGYYVAGLVIGGGSQTGGSGQARSYAVPIRRILDHFQVEPL